MIDKNELLYIVDEFDTQQTPVSRHIAKKTGLWYRTVHVWIVNDKNQILCQKRSLKKDMAPGKWEPAVAGHVTHEDNYFTGAVREVTEETGLSITVNDLNLVKIYKDHETREYRGVFYCKVKADLGSIRMEEDEVAEVKFLSLKTLKRHLLYKRSENWISHSYVKEIFSILN